MGQKFKFAGRLFFIAALAISLIPLSYSFFGDNPAEEFESAFISAYGHGSEDYFGMGDNGLAARWLPDEQVALLDCQIYEQCQFVELVTVEECERSVGVTFNVFNEKDEIVEEGETYSGPLRIGQKLVIEIGTNSTSEDIYFDFEHAKCITDNVAI